MQSKTASPSREEPRDSNIISALLPALTPAERNAYGWLLKSSLGVLAAGRLPAPGEPGRDRVDQILQALALMEVAGPVVDTPFLNPHEVMALREAEGVPTSPGTPLQHCGRAARSAASYTEGLRADLLHLLEGSFGKLLPTGAAEIVEGTPGRGDDSWLDVKSFAIQAYIVLQADEGTQMEINHPGAGTRRLPLRAGQVIALHAGVVPHAVVGDGSAQSVALVRYSYLPQTLLPRTAHLVSTPKCVTSEIVRLTGLSRGSLFVDIGCGDASVLLEVCRATGARGLGLEQDGPTAAAARARIAEADMQREIRISEQSLKNVGIEHADLIFAFLNPETNEELRTAIEDGRIRGSVLVTYGWPMRQWKPTSVHVITLPGARQPVCLYRYALPTW
jgi:hypothetical protein